MRKFRVQGFVLLTAVVALGFPGVAVAELRSGSVEDPRDVPESLNGPRQVDIESVRASFDTAAGALSVTVRLYEPYQQTSMSYPNFSAFVGSRNSGPSAGYGCYGYGADGDASLVGYLDPMSSSGGSLSMRGFDGSLPVTRTISADGRETTFAVQAAQMAGRDYVCLSGNRVWAPDSDGHCSPSINNCERISYSYTGDTTSDFFFAGFAPVRPACDDGVDNDGDGKVDINDPECNYNFSGTSEGQPPPAPVPPAPPAACGNGVDDDGDGRVDNNDPGCKDDADRDERDPAAVRSSFKLTSLRATRNCRLDVEVEVLPDLEPVELFPFVSVRVTVRGVSGQGTGYRRTRRLRLGEDPGYRFKLKPGRYRVSGFYPGDRFRLRSRQHVRHVSVCAKKRR